VTVIRAIQRALQTQGYYNGALDGQLGRQTYAAVESFQTARGLSTGGLTLRTVDALGVDWRSMVSGTNVGINGGFTTGGTTTGTTGGFTTGTTVTTTTSGYTVGSDNVVRTGAGQVLGTLRANGDVVNSAGQVVLRGFSAGGGSTTGYTIGSDNSVRDASGNLIGTLRTNGDVVNSSGQVVISGLSTTAATSGSNLLNGGTVGSAVTSVTSGDYTVRADGTVVDTSGNVIGQVNANGEIIANGQVIGRVRPRN